MMKRIAVAIVAATALAAPMAAIPAGPAAADLDAPWCHSDDLKASYRSTGAGAGHAYGVIRLKNVSDHACVTSGYGGLSYVGKHGKQVGTAAWRTPSPVRLVLLYPDERAVSAVDEVSAGNFPRRRCDPVHVKGFRVFAPDTTRSKFVPHPTTGCARHRVHLLTHKAFRAAWG